MTDSDQVPAPPAGGGARRRRWRLALPLVGIAALVVAAASAGSIAHHKVGAAVVRSSLVGRPAPPLSGETVSGGRLSLAAYHGRWVIVNFFATWCVPCQKEIPELVRFAAAHRGAADPAVVGVVFQDDDASVRSFVHDHGVTWPLLAYRSVDTADAYGVAGIPVTFLVAPDGRLATKVLGGLGPGQLDTLLASARTDPTASTAPSPASLPTASP